ncbi:hypothetical protein FF1_019309 [Malus domestica]
MVGLVNSDFVEPCDDLAGGELDVGIGEGVAVIAVDQSGVVYELGDVFKAVGVKREVVWDVNIREFGTKNKLIIFVMVLHWICV